MIKSELTDSRCLLCKHVSPFTGGCKAYPNGIPYEIAEGIRTHYKVETGQLGNYVFEEGEPDQITELKTLNSYLKKGSERFTEPLSIDNYIQLRGDEIISWDLFFDDFIQKIENAYQSELPKLSDMLEILKLSLNEQINDPFEKSITSLKYGVARIEKLQYILSFRLSNKTKNNNPIRKKEPFNSLFDAAVSLQSLDQMFSILIKGKLIDEESHKLIDRDNGTKGHFIKTLRLLNDKGYFKRPPTALEYVAICKNPFDLDVGLSTVKLHKESDSEVKVPLFDFNN